MRPPARPACQAVPVTSSRTAGQGAGSPSRRKVRPSLLWLLLALAALLAGLVIAVAMVINTFTGVITEVVGFTSEREVAAGQVTVWLAVEQPPSEVRLVGPGGVEPELTAASKPGTVVIRGLRWRRGYTATITEPGRYRVEATGGQAALPKASSLDTDQVRRDGVTMPLVAATGGFSLCLLIGSTVLVLRAVSRRRPPLPGDRVGGS